jgi:hypothetical protein
VHEVCFEAFADNEAVRRLLDEIEVVPLEAGGMIERRVRLSTLPKSDLDQEVLSVIDEVRGSS